MDKKTKIKKINFKRITALIVSGFVLANVASCSIKESKKTSNEIIGYEEFIDSEYTDIDLQVIDFFEKLKNYKNYILENKDLFSYENEVESLVMSVENFLFFKYDINSIINGHMEFNHFDNVYFHVSDGFSENMKNTIYFDGDTNIKASDLSKKGMYDIIQIAQEIVTDLKSELSNYFSYNKYSEFVENGELLLLPKESNFDKFLQLICIGSNENRNSYDNYYSYKNTIIEFKDSFNEDFSEALEIIDDAKEKVNTWIKNR